MNVLRRRKGLGRTSEKAASSSLAVDELGHNNKQEQKNLSDDGKKSCISDSEAGQESESRSNGSNASTAPDSSSTSTYQEMRKSKKSTKHVRWNCLDSCCWLIGYICCIWWLLLVLYKALPSLSEVITGPLPDPPGIALKKEGLRARHPVVFVPGIVTGGLELWEGHACADGLFRKRLWGGTFGEVYKRPFCWLEHMALDNVTGLDPEGIRVRPVSGLVAADYFAPGYFVWAVLIENLAKLGYEEKNMHMAAYDWRLSFQNTEVRDRSLSRLKNTIELMVQTNGGKKVVVIPHSMGALYFLHFIKWVEAPLPMGGGGGPDWCARHIKAIMNIAGPLLGVPKAVSGLLSSEAKDIAVARAIAPGVMDSEIFGLATLMHIMRVTRTWDSTMSMIPKGGEVIWGGADWSPEEGYDCLSKSEESDKKDHNWMESSSKILGTHGKPKAHYGRLISFGKEAATISSHQLKETLFKKKRHRGVPVSANISCGDVWTEYHEISFEDIQTIAEHKVFSAEMIPELLRFVAPKMMQRGDLQFSHGVAEDFSDPKYDHFKYWSNPLETRLPNAPDMELYCMYGVGILTERSYIYKVSPHAEACHIPFRIDPTAHKDSEGCLKGGVHFVDGDETVPVLSAGLMCAKGWKGKTCFNPSGSRTFVREYSHTPPANLLEGRGTQSGAHVDIMGNFALIEDILRVAAGASGDEIGGDKIYSDLLKWAERIPI